MVPVSIFYVLNVVVALTALRSVNVPMYGALKRLTTVVTLIGFNILNTKLKFNLAKFSNRRISFIK